MNYIIYGEQYPLIRKSLNLKLKELLGEPDDFNVAQIDMKDSSVNEIVNEASMLPLGYDKKVVVVDNAYFLKKDGKKEDKEKILELLKNSQDDIAIIFILRSNEIDKNGKIFQYVYEKWHGNISTEIEPNEWPGYIAQYFKKRNVSITRDAINELNNRVNGDIGKFINEANKLCLYSNKIDINDVALMVSKPLENNAFQMSNALFAGDNGLAVSIYRDLKLLGSEFIDPLIPMLATQFRFISEVRFLSSQHLSNDDIAKQLGVSSGRVYMALKNSKSLSRRQISRALDSLYNLDLQIKSGQIDRSYGLELFLINFPN